MELGDAQQGLLEAYLAEFGPLIGDRRTGRLLAGTVAGILGAQSLVTTRIAAFSP